MGSKYESSVPFVDNLYAFVGWVVAYSDYGKEMAVDTVLKRCKLIEKLDDSLAFEDKKEYDMYGSIMNKCLKEVVLDNEEKIQLTLDEVRRCEELSKEFTPRFKRAKQFTIEQIAGYKARKIVKKDDGIRVTLPASPIKLVDHENKQVVCLFYSSEHATRVLGANMRKINEVVSRNGFYKGYVWMPCSMEEYKRYEKKLKAYI